MVQIFLGVGVKAWKNQTRTFVLYILAPDYGEGRRNVDLVSLRSFPSKLRDQDTTGFFPSCTCDVSFKCNALADPGRQGTEQ